MKDTVVILGTHPRGEKSFDTTRTDCDIWLFNESGAQGIYKHLSPTAVFQLHHPAIWKNPKNRCDPNHFKWLSTQDTCTIYMQEKYPEVPMSEAYPIDEVFKMLENVSINEKQSFRYSGSTPDYAMGLAAHLGYKRVEIHGIEMEMGSEYSFQRLGFGFWSGFLAGKGIELKIYSKIYNAPLYGYEGDVAIDKNEIQKRIETIKVEQGEYKEDYIKRAKEFIEDVDGFLKKDYIETFRMDLRDIMETARPLAILNGRIKELERYLEKANAMNAETGKSVFSLEEFETAGKQRAIQHNQQLKEVAIIGQNLDATVNKITKRRKPIKNRKLINSLKTIVKDFLNNNVSMWHTIGAINENQYYKNSLELSLKRAMGEDYNGD